MICVQFQAFKNLFPHKKQESTRKFEFFWKKKRFQLWYRYPNWTLVSVAHYCPMKYKLYHVWSILQLGGDVKPLHFLNALRYEDYLSEYRSKILYLHLESIPQSFIKDGWLAEAYLRNYMSVNALNLIKGEKIMAIFWRFLMKSGIFEVSWPFWLFR